MFLDERIFNVRSVRDHFAVQLFLSLKGPNFGFFSVLAAFFKGFKCWFESLEALGLLGFDGLRSEDVLPNSLCAGTLQMFLWAWFIFLLLQKKRTEICIDLAALSVAAVLVCCLWGGCVGRRTVLGPGWRPVVQDDAGSCPGAFPEATLCKRAVEGLALGAGPTRRGAGC